MIKKPLYWVSGSKKELLSFPKLLIHDFGSALLACQLGKPVDSVKTLTQFRPHVLELLDRDRSGTYRVVFCAAFEGVIYVLHCFQKKSKSGIATPQQNLDLVAERLKKARQDYEENHSQR